MADSYPQTVSEFLDQGDWWVNKQGWLRIGEMNVDHRRRAAQFLLRRARFFGTWVLDEEEGAWTVVSGHQEVQEFVGRLAAPAAFMKRTKLYQRLIQGGADPELFRRFTPDDE